MSNIQYAFIARQRVPDRAALQAAITALGFDLQLHPRYAPFAESGFLPCVLNGEEGPGFEICQGPASEWLGDDPALRASVAGRDHCISLAWHGSMQDLACVMIVCSALARDFDALVSYEGEPPEPLETLLAAAREALEEPPEAWSRKVAATMGPGPAGSGRKKPWWKLW
jgi:hypothetical protein